MPMFSDLCHLSRHLISSGHVFSFTRSRYLNFGLPRFLFPSIAICNISLVAPSLSHLYTCPTHLNLQPFFPPAHCNMHISLVRNFLSCFFLTRQHSGPYIWFHNGLVHFVSPLSHITPIVYIFLNLHQTKSPYT